MFSNIFSENSMIVRICLAPEQLNSNYLNILLSLLKTKYEKTCVKNIGYIHEIINIKKILHQEIMKMTPDVMFIIQISIKSYKPKENDKLELKIDHIFHQGIFGGIDKIKILVPIHLCSDYIIEHDKSLILVNKNDPKKIIQTNQLVMVQLQKIRFEKDNYSCLAILL